MLCPYCITNIAGDTAKCVNCGREVPPLYRQYYPTSPFSKPPLIMSAVGFSAHGKTIYFASLLHVIDSQLTEVWPGFYRQAIDHEAIRTVHNNLQLLSQGQVPFSTPKNFPEPNIHRLVNVPGKGDRLLTIYDASGESFNEDLQMERFAVYLKKARAVMFLISLNDLEEPLDKDIHRLLNIYVQGMARLKARTRDQHLIVVYTKADTLHNRFRDYPEVAAHLSTSSYRQLSNPERYMHNLQQVSDALRDYTYNELGARSFCNMADSSFRSVQFCAVSSLGSATEGGHLKAKMTPIRVADPLMWMLHVGTRNWNIFRTTTTGKSLTKPSFTFGAPPVDEGLPPARDAVTQARLSRLSDFMIAHCSRDDLEDVVFALGFNTEDFGPLGRLALARRIAAIMWQSGRLDELAAQLALVIPEHATDLHGSDWSLG